MVNQECFSQLSENETIMDELETVVHDKEEGIESKSSSSTQVKENIPVSEINPLGTLY